MTASGTFGRSRGPGLSATTPTVGAVTRARLGPALASVGFALLTAAACSRSELPGLLPGDSQDAGFEGGDVQDATLDRGQVHDATLERFSMARNEKGCLSSEVRVNGRSRDQSLFSRSA